MKKYLLLFVLAVLFAGCGNNENEKAKELMTAAEKFEKSNQNKEALAKYDQVLAEYPNSESAPVALHKSGILFQTMKFAEKNPQESFLEAANRFEKVADQYPKYEKAAEALFMAGFLLNNELQNYTKATEVYNKLIEKFPGTSYAKDAKDELNNMGKSPEEILEQALKNKNKNI